MSGRGRGGGRGGALWRIGAPLIGEKMMLGRAAFAHLRNSFQQQHAQIRQHLETSKSTEQLSSKRVVDSVNVVVEEQQSMSSVASLNRERRKSVSSSKSRRTVSPSSTSTRRSSSVSASTNRRSSTSSANVVDTDDDGVVLVNDGAKICYIDTTSTFDGNLTLSKFDLLHAVRYKLEHNEIGRASLAEKRRICSVVGDHLRCGDPDLVLYASQVRTFEFLSKENLSLGQEPRSRTLLGET